MRTFKVQFPTLFEPKDSSNPPAFHFPNTKTQFSLISSLRRSSMKSLIQVVPYSKYFSKECRSVLINAEQTKRKNILRCLSKRFSLTSDLISVTDEWRIRSRNWHLFIKPNRILLVTVFHQAWSHWVDEFHKSLHVRLDLRASEKILDISANILNRISHHRGESRAQLNARDAEWLTVVSKSVCACLKTFLFHFCCLSHCQDIAHTV